MLSASLSLSLLAPLFDSLFLEPPLLQTAFQFVLSLSICFSLLLLSLTIRISILRNPLKSICHSFCFKASHWNLSLTHTLSLSLFLHSWSFPRFVPMSTAQQQLNKLARRATLDSHCDSELEPTESTSDSIILPELIGHSELLTQQRMYCVSRLIQALLFERLLTLLLNVYLNHSSLLQLLEHLPGRAVSSAWQLIFSTSVHGFSVSTMFRNMTPFKDKPVLLIIECTKGSVGWFMIQLNVLVLKF